MSPPQLSICIPVYNRPALVARAIESALAQPRLDYEIVVVDNHSDDGTWAAVAAYASRGVRCYRNPENLGPLPNFNRCLELARGDFIRILCADDTLLPDRVREELQLLQSHPEVAVLSGPAPVVDTRGHKLYEAGDHLPAGVYPAGCATIANLLWILAAYGYNPLNYPSGITIRRAAAQQAGGFDAFSDGTWDFDYWLRLLRFGGLGIAPRSSCVVLDHAGAGSGPLLRNGGYLAGQIAVAERCWSCLEAQGVADAVASHLEARAYWLTLKMASHRELTAACRYWRMTTWRRRGRSAGTRALAHHLGLRARRRWNGTRLSRQQAKPW